MFEAKVKLFKGKTHSLISNIAADLKDLSDPTSLLYRDPEHIQDLEARYNMKILDMAKLVDGARKEGFIQ